MANLLESYWWLTLVVSAIAGTIILLRKVIEWGESSGLLPNEKIDAKQIDLPPGIVMMQLSSPLCFAALSHSTDLISEYRPKGIHVVILRVRESFPLTKSEMIVMDCAVESLIKKKFFVVVASKTYQASKQDLAKNPKWSERLLLVHTVEQALEAAARWQAKEALI